ncbi:MAG TPA: N-acetylgalactosamine 6-sulfate sulfatase, partial [Caulifigura sp.]|nr:N-acetylgalactosamine 6-sulfate sulfatase [Caulifigura sp.]
LRRLELPKDGGQVKWELYNLKADEKETTDLAAKEPERAKAMQGAIETWLKSVVGSLNGRDY